MRFIGLVVLLLVGCSDGAPATVAESVTQPVKLYTVASGDGQRLREFPAVIEAAQVAQLAFRVGGEIEAFPARAGTDVQQGDLIARLDPTDYQLVVDQAQARYDLAFAQFNRTENLVQQGVISPQQFDEVKANLEISRANLDTAKSNLNYTELRAPFAGVIAHVFVENFETVQPQRQIATLQMSDAIDVSIRVPESLFARVQRNSDYQPDVIFAAAPEQAFSATLKEFDTTADPSTNTYKVVFTLPSPREFNVLPGMSATLRVDMDAVSQQLVNALLVPTTALFSPSEEPQAQGYFVWVYDPDAQTVSKRAVETGAITNEGVEITSGLTAGEQVVTAGVYQLNEGQTVRPWLRERGL